MGFFGLLQTVVDGGKLFFKRFFGFLFFAPLFFACGLVLVYSPLFWVFCFLACGSFLMALICFFNFNFFGFLSFFRSNVLSIAFDVLFCFLAFFGLFYFFEFWALSLSLFFVVLLEVGRTPFDLNEGESELVSGYNIEYSSIRFTMLFLGEYLGLIFCVVLLGLLFTLTFFEVFFALFCLVQIRSILPRLKFFGVYSLGFGFFGLLALPFYCPLTLALLRLESFLARPALTPLTTVQ